MTRLGRSKGDGGVVMVEFALLLPLIALVVFGVMEYGLVLQDRLSVQSATRAGVRVGSAAGNDVAADKNLLLGVGAALNDLSLSNVDWVLVFRSSSAEGAVPPACTNPPKKVAGSCNLYTGAQISQVVAGTAPAGWFGCGGLSLDGSWCPANRQTIQANGTDYLGVWVQARHPMITGFFGSTITMTDRGVMRLEPKGV